MAATTTKLVLFQSARLEETKPLRKDDRTNEGFPFPVQKPEKPALFLSKPSWIVRTESNVHRELRKRPDPPCVVCHGSGRVDCHRCRGKGRTNYVDRAMLPRGEWPKWCRTCGGSGLDYCSRCLGTGEYRYIMGFQFMRRETNDSPDNEKRRNQESEEDSRSTADRLLNNDQGM